MGLGGLRGIALPSHIPYLAASVQINTAVSPAWKRQVPVEKQPARCRGLVASEGQRPVLMGACWGALQSPTIHYGSPLPWPPPQGLWKGWGAALWTSGFGSAVRAVSASRYLNVPSTNPRDSGNNTCEKTLQRRLGRNSPIGMFPLSLASQDFSWAAENNSSNNNNITFFLIFL